MKKRVKIFPYKIGSVSAKALAQKLGVKRIIPHGAWKPKRRSIVINWGSSEASTANTTLNPPQAVKNAVNKKTAFGILKAAGVSVPEFTSDKAVAAQWQQEGFRVVCRHLLCSHSGRGIEIVQPEGILPYAPLYVKYTRKEKEYRVHVFKGQVIDLAEKKRKAGVERSTGLIRNLANGWIFARDGVVCSELVKREAIKAVSALGLDFGAVDVIEKAGKIYILEVNTSPGLQGTTLLLYAKAMDKWLQEQR